MKVIGRHGDSVSIDTGSEIIKLNGPVYIISWLHLESLTRFDFIHRPNGQLQLLNVHIHCRKDLPKDRKEMLVTLRINPCGVTRLAIEDGVRYLELSPVELMNIYCLGIAAYPEFSLKQILRWERKLIAGTGHDAVDAERTVWAAIRGISHGNPEIAAWVADQTSNYSADVAGYRAQFDHGR